MRDALSMRCRAMDGAGWRRAGSQGWSITFSGLHPEAVKLAGRGGSRDVRGGGARDIEVGAGDVIGLLQSASRPSQLELTQPDLKCDCGRQIDRHREGRSEERRVKKE